MHVKHGKGYTTADRMKYKDEIHKCVFTAVTILVEAMRVLNIPCSSPHNQVATTKLY